MASDAREQCRRASPERLAGSRVARVVQQRLDSVPQVLPRRRLVVQLLPVHRLKQVHLRSQERQARWPPQVRVR